MTVPVPEIMDSMADSTLKIVLDQMTVPVLEIMDGSSYTVSLEPFRLRFLNRWPGAAALVL
jgi:hypothetical protein